MGRRLERDSTETYNKFSYMIFFEEHSHCKKDGRLLLRHYHWHPSCSTLKAYIHSRGADMLPGSGRITHCLVVG